MSELSRKLVQAAEALMVIALDSSVGPVNGKQLAERIGMPPRFLEPTLQMLVHAGILRSTRGPRGGYSLGRERRRITLRDIRVALADADPVQEISVETAAVRDVLSPVLNELEMRWMDALGSVSLAELCDRVRMRQTAQQYAHAVRQESLAVQE